MENVYICMQLLNLTFRNMPYICGRRKYFITNRFINYTLFKHYYDDELCGTRSTNGEVENWTVFQWNTVVINQACLWEREWNLGPIQRRGFSSVGERLSTSGTGFSSEGLVSCTELIRYYVGLHVIWYSYPHQRGFRISILWHVLQAILTCFGSPLILYATCNKILLLARGPSSSWRNGIEEPEETALARKGSIKGDATMKGLLKTIFSAGSVPRLYKENKLELSGSRECEDIWSHGSGARRSPAGNNGIREHCWDLLPGNY
jgi:hypothetical protein